TERGAPLRIGGWPDPDARRTRGAIEIPRGLSILAFHDPDARVQGLDAFPRRDWPDTRVVHVAFQVMVFCGVVLAFVAVAWLATTLCRRRAATSRAMLVAVVGAGPLGFVALEAGWVVTEVGRQPWIIYGLVRTSEAVTPIG